MRTCGLFVLFALFVTLGGAVGNADSLDSIPPGSTDEIPSIDTAGSAATTSSDNGSFEYPMSPERHAKLVAYSRFNSRWRFVDFFVTVGVYAIILLSGLAARIRDWVAGIKPRFFGLWLFAALFITADYLLNLPFSAYRGYFVEAEYGFMNQSFMEWWGEDILGTLITVVFIIVPVWFFYWLVGKFRNWWLYFSLGSMPLLVLAVIIIPIFIAPLFNDYEPLKDKALETRILALADKAGIDQANVFEVNASKQSAKLGAYVTGLFGSKRIVLYDTLIKNFTPDEVSFVMGHEMGHYVKHHIWWGLGVTCVFLMFMLWLTNLTIQPVIRRFKKSFGFETLSDWASLPLVMIYLTVISFLFQPVTNAYSRHQERMCDRYGMQISGVDGETAARAFDKLSVYNLSDPDPAPIVEFWFYDHPALKKRMAYVRSLKF